MYKILSFQYIINIKNPEEIVYILFVIHTTYVFCTYRTSEFGLTSF
jgi:hypothetical protein